MRKFCGVWLDYRKAVIVIYEKASRSFEESDIVLTKILSDFERKTFIKGASGWKTPWSVDVSNKSKSRQKRYLKIYYENIIEVIRDSDRLLIMGPGDAKIELKREVAKSRGLSKKIGAVQTCEKMTDNQIIERVKHYFDPADSTQLDKKFA